MRTPTQDLMRRLKDVEYRKGHGRESAREELAISFSRIRRQLDLTQEEFAEKIGKNQSYIARIENGNAEPTIGDIGAMLALIDLRIEIHIEKLVEDE